MLRVKAVCPERITSHRYRWVWRVQWPQEDGWSSGRVPLSMGQFFPVVSHTAGTSLSPLAKKARGGSSPTAVPAARTVWLWILPTWCEIPPVLTWALAWLWFLLTIVILLWFKRCPSNPETEPSLGVFLYLCIVWACADRCLSSGLSRWIRLGLSAQNLTMVVKKSWRLLNTCHEPDTLRKIRGLSDIFSTY